MSSSTTLFAIQHDDWVRFLDASADDVIARAWEQVKLRGNAFKDVDYEHWWVVCMSMLPAFPDGMFRNLISSKVLPEYIGNLSFRADVDKLTYMFNAKGNIIRDAKTGKKEVYNKAGIYANIFGTASGESLTPAQIKRGAEKMQKYQDDLTYAADLDVRHFQWRLANKPKSTGGQFPVWKHSMTSQSTRSITGDSKDNKVSQNVHEKIDKFIEKLLEIVEIYDENSPAWHEPIDVYFSEFGWASDCQSRLNAHKSWSSTNQIMKLFRAVCEVEFPAWGIQMHQFVVYRVFEAQQAAVAEAFITEIANGYIDNGWGFSHWPAGQNNPVEKADEMVFSRMKSEMLAGSKYDLKRKDYLAQRSARLKAIEEKERLEQELAYLDSPAGEEQKRLALAREYDRLLAIEEVLDRLDDIDRREREWEEEQRAKTDDA